MGNHFSYFRYFPHYPNYSKIPQVAVLLCTLLAGCAGLHAPQPENRNMAADDRIATDTANQLARLYPPAKTQFNLVLSDPQGFGTMLSDKLRAKGYAVSETKEKASRFPFDAFGAAFQPKADIGGGQETALPKTGPGTAAGAATAIELRYILNEARMDPLLRIMVKIGDARLARAYLADQGNVAAAGAWTFRGE